MSEMDDLQTHIDILSNPDASTDDRIDACHALGNIAGEGSEKALIETLVDRDFGVRWAAAEALCQHGHTAVLPLLRELETHPADQRLYENAHHILKLIGEPALKSIIQPVLSALEEPTGSEIAVPLAAFNALGELRQYSP